jgi:hypothetical protein
VEAMFHIQCSALTGENVPEVFSRAMRETLIWQRTTGKKKKTKKKKKVITKKGKKK